MSYGRNAVKKIMVIACMVASMTKTAQEVSQLSSFELLAPDIIREHVAQRLPLKSQVMLAAVSQTLRTLLLENLTPQTAQLRFWWQPDIKPCGALGKGLTFRATAFSGDGNLVAGATDNGFHLFDCKSCNRTGMIERHGEYSALSFLPNGKFLVAGTATGLIIIIDLVSAEIIQRLIGHTDLVFSLNYFPKHSIMKSCANDHSVRTWNLDTGKEIGQPQRHSQPLIGDRATLAADCTVLARNNYMHINLWNVDLDKEIKEIDGNTSIKTVLIEDGSSQEARALISALAFSPDGRVLAIGFRCGAIRFFDVESDRQLRILTVHNKQVCALAFAPQGTMLASACPEEGILLWAH